MNWNCQSCPTKKKQVRACHSGLQTGLKNSKISSLLTKANEAGCANQPHKKTASVYSGLQTGSTMSKNLLLANKRPTKTDMPIMPCKKTVSTSVFFWITNRIKEMKRRSPCYQRCENRYKSTIRISRHVLRVQAWEPKGPPDKHRTPSCLHVCTNEAVHEATTCDLQPSSPTLSSHLPGVHLYHNLVEHELNSASFFRGIC